MLNLDIRPAHLAKNYGILLVAAWTVLIAAAFLWLYHDAEKEHFEKARIEARTFFELNLAYRRWAARHGGVYVPVTEDFKPNPYLNVPQRDVTTTSGRKLTLVNPAWMTRQVFELLGAQSDQPVVSHMTSLRYINPADKPDPWEEEGLRAFERGTREVSTISTINGAPYMRLLRPFVTEEDCLKCHGDQGYKVGDIRGGIGIGVPMKPFLDALSRDRTTSALIYGVIWMIGVAVIMTLTRNIREKERVILGSEEKYRLLFENNPQPMWVYDIETLAFLAVNDAAVGKYGWSRDEFLGMTIRDIRPTEDTPNLLESVARHTGGVDEAGTWRHLTKSGNLIYVEITKHTVDFSGRPAELVMANDVTEKKKLEAQLRQAQKMEAVGQLAGGIAHDFNNILTAIIGYGNLIEMKMGANDPLRSYVRQVLSAAEKAANLTQSLLTFSRKQIINPKPIDLNETIRKVERLLSRLIGEDVELSMELSAVVLTVLADSGQIEQVLMNLATNARDAMPKGGKFTIETMPVEIDDEFVRTHHYGRPGRYALMSLTDNGVGMDDWTRQRIFEPFFTTKEMGRGTGLGLAIVYGIVKQHEGYINVYSEPDKGTTFRIYLPLLSETSREHEETGSHPVTGGSETILLVEDDAAVRGSTRTVLEQYGYRIIEAADGVEAIDAFSGNIRDIDLVLLDVVLPRKSGKEVHDEIKGMRPEIPVLFVSGYTADIIHHKGVLSEGLQFLSKPASPRELLAKVREVLDTRPGK